MSLCKIENKYLIDKDSWSIILEETSLDYDDKFDKLILEGHTLLCLHSDGFWKPTLKHPSTFVWFPEDLWLIFHISDFIRRMCELTNRFWLETDGFFNTTENNNQKIRKGVLSTVFPYTN